MLGIHLISRRPNFKCILLFAISLNLEIFTIKTTFKRLIKESICKKVYTETKHVLNFSLSNNFFSQSNWFLSKSNRELLLLRRH